MNKLKNCPFCGKKPNKPYSCMGLVHPKKKPVLWMIDCDGCQANIYASTKAQVIKAWNKRA